MGNFWGRDKIAASAVVVAVLLGMIILNVLLSQKSSHSTDPQLSLINPMVEKVGVSSSDIIGIRVTNSNKEAKHYIIRFIQSEIIVKSEKIYVPSLSRKTLYILLRGVIPGNTLTLQLEGYPAKIFIPIVG